MLAGRMMNTEVVSYETYKQRYMEALLLPLHFLKQCYGKDTIRGTEEGNEGWNLEGFQRRRHRQAIFKDARDFRRQRT